MRSVNEEALGIGIIGVVMGQLENNPEGPIFPDRHLEFNEVHGAFDAIRRLAKERFKRRVFLISASKPLLQTHILHWLSRQGFYNKTGLTVSNVRFCTEVREKASIAKKLRITHFIDHRLEALNHLTLPVRDHYLFRPDPKEVEQYSLFRDNARRVNGWEQVLDHFF